MSKTGVSNIANSQKDVVEPESKNNADYSGGNSPLGVAEFPYQQKRLKNLRWGALWELSAALL